MREVAYEEQGFREHDTVTVEEVDFAMLLGPIPGWLDDKD